MPDQSSGAAGTALRAPQLYLASRSPRRRMLLEQIGVEYQVLALTLDERVLPGEVPTDYVRRVAFEKACAGRDLVRHGSAFPARPVLAADTAVVLDGSILGKPRGSADAAAMLRQLAGRTHEVLTAVALLCVDPDTAQAGGTHQALSVSRVTLRALTEREIAAYWATGEPCDKAGAYAIQGLGALFVSDLEGSHSGVTGLPLFETGRLLARVGINPLDRAGQSAVAAPVRDASDQTQDSASIRTFGS